MKRTIAAFASTLLIMGCTFASAQSDTNLKSVSQPDDNISSTYSFKTINFTGDPFTQLLGINDDGLIAGYHGSGMTPTTPNKGFRLILPNTFVAENAPNSAQTQVIGVNEDQDTVGFFVDAKGATHGFIRDEGHFKVVAFPNTTFNQLLGVNDLEQAAGYWQDLAGNFHPYTWDDNGHVFQSILIPGSVSAQATGINNRQSVSGFFIDSKGVNHGFALIHGGLVQLDVPGSTLTQALGLNNHDDVVGFYVDAANLTHGFLWDGSFHTIDDPSGVGSTVVNGINDLRHIVGFYGNTAAGISNGFLGEPQDQ
jgi:uncharacterized membrane protein